MTEIRIPKPKDGFNYRGYKGKIKGRKPKAFAKLMFENAFFNFGLSVYKKYEKYGEFTDIEEEVEKLEQELIKLNIDLKELGIRKL